MKTFDRQSCKALRTEINEALRAVAQRHGVTIEAGNASFDDTFIRFKLEVKAPGAADADLAKAADRLAMSGARFTVGDRFDYGQRQFTVKGYNPRRKKSVVAFDLGNGKDYVFPFAVVQQLTAAFRAASVS